MSKHNKYDEAMMKIAHVWAEQSYCKRKKVGAVLSKKSRIISSGYNGTVSGSENCCEELNEKGELISKNTVVHAEANTLSFAGKNGIKTEGCTLYITLSPCIECSKLIIQHGIKEVVYDEEYRDKSGIDFLKKYGVKVRRFKSN